MNQMSHWEWLKNLLLKATEEGKITWNSLPRESQQVGYEAGLTGVPRGLSDVQILLTKSASSVPSASLFKRKRILFEVWQLEIALPSIGVRSFTTDREVFPESQEEVSETEMRAFVDELLLIQDKKSDPVYSYLVKSL